MIDDLFNLIINKSTSIPVEFYCCLEKLNLLYSPEIIEKANLNTQILKDIIYTLYEIYNSNFKYLLPLFRRSSLINIYNICKDAEAKTPINDFIQYYKKSLINKYTESIS